MDTQDFLGWAMFGGFILAWVLFARYGFKNGWSKTISLGGGFIAGLFGVMVVAIPFILDKPSSTSQNSITELAPQASPIAFDTATVASYFAAGSAMIYCDKLSDAQAKNVGNTVMYMGQQGGISKEELKSTVYMAGSLVADDLKANGGCAGAHFKEYERNYYEYSSDPAFAHVRGKNSSITAVNASQPSPLEQIINALESSPNGVCRNFAVTLRNSNPGAEDSILRTSEKYGCL